METQKSEFDEPKAAVKEVSAAGETTDGSPKAAPASPKPAASSNPSFSTPPAANNIYHAVPPPKAFEATPKASHSLEDAIKEVSNIVTSGKVTQADVPAIKAILTEHANLKGKVDKVKSLLGRSAKVQRETKIDLEASQKRLNLATREIERLNQKLDKLQSRPTHMDLLMDFETNFDKALLSVGQTGGQDTAPTTAAAPELEKESALDSMLMQELSESRARIEKLETLNSSLMGRSKQMESSVHTLQRERDTARQVTDRLQMEVKMAQMEAEHATRAMQDKVASLEEMEMEIEMVTKANAKANIRAAKGAEVANSVKTDRQKIQQLESQVQALQEWALASAESKRLIQERCKILENKLKQSQGKPVEEDNEERLLFKKSGSLVVGAGDIAINVLKLGEHAGTVDSRFVILRWRFDSSPSDCEIVFNILKGNCESKAEQKKADYLVKNRTIKGGAGGETEGTFNVDNACTLLWSNERTWIRPRTVKYWVEVVSLK